TCGRDQGQRDERHQNARLEFRTGLLLFPLDPHFDQRAKENEAKDQKDEKDKSRERIQQNYLRRLRRTEKGIEIKGRLYKYNQGQHQQEESRQIELCRLGLHLHNLRKSTLASVYFLRLRASRLRFAERRYSRHPSSARRGMRPKEYIPKNQCPLSK